MPEPGILTTEATETALLGELLNPKLGGYCRYFGIYGNRPSLPQFHNQAMRILFKWLNRRSQRRSYTWPDFLDLVGHFGVPQPVELRTAKASL